MTKKKPGKSKKKVVRDKHILYSAAVQSVDADVDFFEKAYRRYRGKKFQDFREDFCGTAALACEWVGRAGSNRAWAIDLHQPTLDWGRKRYLPRLGDAAERVHLIHGDVLDPAAPEVDLVAALNFSYSVFKTRSALGTYFARVREGLRDDGVFVLDCFGGTEAMCEDTESRKIDKSVAFDGTKVPSFTYVWEQKSFNPVDHHIVCNIHFKLGNGTKMKRAFHYDWRFWTIPELSELMLEAGFSRADTFLEGWDDEADDTDGVFRRRKRFENQSGWVAYVVGVA